MPTGIVLFPNPQAINRVDDVVAQATRAYELGVRQVWLSQQNDHDAIALAAVVGAAVPGLGVGTSVVPINPRHPLIVASLAQTAQAASHGNFSLGLGLGAHQPERQAFGTSWPNTITRLREHLTVLRSIFETGAVDFSGNEISAQPGWPVRVAGGTPVPVYVAAMGPKALQVTGELADGTLPYLAGPRTIAEFIEPAIAKSAADAGRQTPGSSRRCPQSCPTTLMRQDIRGRAVELLRGNSVVSEGDCARRYRKRGKPCRGGFSGIGQASASELSGCGCD